MTGMPMPEMPLSTSARLQASPIADGGTDVERWTRWDRRFAALDLTDCPGLTVIAPHPDDETLGMGATVAMLRAAGVDVQLVSVTDGGAAYPGLDDCGRAALATVRCAEVRRAAEVLGAGDPIRLQLPDGAVAGHEQRLTEQVTELLNAFPAGRWCAATWRGDGHPDHEAVGRAAAAAAARSGAVFVEYPVWMWHWAQPDDPAVPWHRARRVFPTKAALHAKQAATRCFSSQIEPTPGAGPVLPPAVVHRLLAVGEVVFV
jgi:LmbE family N-acetylglucosaminyl deacetylase